MEQDIKDNGLKELKKGKEKVLKYGQMVQCMKAGGRVIRLMEEED